MNDPDLLQLMQVHPKMPTPLYQVRLAEYYDGLCLAHNRAGVMNDPSPVSPPTSCP